MQRVCSKCNTLVTGDGAFCPSCGEPLPAAVQLDKTPQTTPMGDASQAYSQNAGYSQQSTGYGSQSGYTAPQPSVIPDYSRSNAQQFSNIQPVNDTDMTLGQWVGTIILTTWFGIVSLILCIVWGVSNDTPITKKRYCQAMIIINCIGIAASIIFTIVFASIMAGVSAGAGNYYYG